MTEPRRARAVLSTQDFTLIRRALIYYLQAHDRDPEAEKFAHLYHRIGSAMPEPHIAAA